MSTLYESENAVALARKGAQVTGEVAELLEVRILGTPPLEQVKELSDRMVEHIYATNPCKVALHVLTNDNLSLPDVSVLLYVVGQLLSLQDVVRSRLLCTCVQTGALDDMSVLIRNSFLTMYQPVAPFEIVEGERAAEAFMQRFLQP